LVTKFYRWDVYPEKLWPNATIPYAISPLYDSEDYITIYSAIRKLNFMTCVKFVPWNGKDKDFLLIWPIKYPKVRLSQPKIWNFNWFWFYLSKGCWSYVGKTGGPQILSLTPPDSNGPNCLGDEGRALHELMHALGIFHEQSRSDRDRFVKVHWDNILPGRSIILLTYFSDRFSHTQHIVEILKNNHWPIQRTALSTTTIQ
jgi:hypothetical protein